MKPTIIAEIGSNVFKYHSDNQNLRMAYTQIEGAKDAGATAVKFQMFTAEELWGIKCAGKTYANIQNRFSLPPSWLPELRDKCRKSSIQFLCSGFSIPGFKTISPYVTKHKLASPEATNERMLNFLMDQPKPVIASLGCMRNTIITDFIEKLRPGIDIILECVSQYPANELEYDLVKMLKLASRYQLDWGISDHTKGNNLAKLARSLGATYFEKHVDFSFGLGRETPDTAVSINGVQFEEYVKSIQSSRKIDYDVGKKLAHKLYAHRKSSCAKDATLGRPLPEWE